jgi:hypothetical protein
MNLSTIIAVAVLGAFAAGAARASRRLHVLRSELLLGPALSLGTTATGLLQPAARSLPERRAPL